jgi:mono/diheme cytochrome c family protein
MREFLKSLLLIKLVVVLFGAVVVAYVVRTGLSARDEPGVFETWLARRVRNLAVPDDVRDRRNPVPASAEALEDGLAHFADHCAICHGNDGSGQTQMGQGLYPKAPDMRLPATQELTDGELFHIIENGVRFTGMPAWGTGTAEGERASWHLVHFVRHLPKITPVELERMEALNPRSPEEIRQEIEEERFLEGGGEAAPAQPPAPHRHPGGRDE